MCPLTPLQIIVQGLLSYFHTSSCSTSSQLWLLMVAFLIPSLYYMVQLFIFIYLEVSLFCALPSSQALFFSCSYLAAFWQIFPLPALITLPCSLHYLLDLAAAVGAVDANQTSDILLPTWYPWSDGPGVYPTLAVLWSGHVTNGPTEKAKPSPRHYKSDQWSGSVSDLFMSAAHNYLEHCHVWFTCLAVQLP